MPVESSALPDEPAVAKPLVNVSEPDAPAVDAPDVTVTEPEFVTDADPVLTVALPEPRPSPVTKLVEPETAPAWFPPAPVRMFTNPVVPLVDGPVCRVMLPVVVPAVPELSKMAPESPFVAYPVERVSDPEFASPEFPVNKLAEPDDPTVVDRAVLRTSEPLSP